MPHEIARRSHWIIRAMEWDDAKARYPNIWHDGMPRYLIVLDRIGGRLRLGDLVATYYPTSQRHPERSESFLGLSRVTGLRASERSGYAWVDLETAHRFEPVLKPTQTPRRVFLCCDPGWPDDEVALFREVFDAAVAAGWQPRDDECGPTAPSEKTDTAIGSEPTTQADAQTAEPTGVAEPASDAHPGAEAPPAEPAKDVETAPEPETAGLRSQPQIRGRLFAGADFSGDMRDPREGTWLAIVQLVDDRLEVTRLDATGRHGLESRLRNPDAMLMSAEAIGLDFPFALPQAFSETLLGGAFPDSGWWGLVKRLERLSRPEFLAAVHEFREAQGELKRYTDEAAATPSPLCRDRRDLSPMSFHGIRMIGEDRSRYAVRPFESAQGRLLLEVDPEGWMRWLTESSGKESNGALRKSVVERLPRLETLPVQLSAEFRRACCGWQAAIEAVLAARCAAVAVISGEADKSPEELAPDHADQLRREGWIYAAPAPAGLGRPSSAK